MLLLVWLACNASNDPSSDSDGLDPTATDASDTSAGSVDTSDTPTDSGGRPIAAPKEPWAGEVLRCEAPAGTANVSWLRNGSPWGGVTETFAVVGDTIPIGVSQAGDIWTCVVEGVESPPVTVDAPGGNVLVILLDDLGMDKVSFGYHPAPPPTPTFDRLRSEGISFDQAYSYPACSSTRAAILTGRFGRRTGVGNAIHLETDDYQLPLDELTMPELLREGSAHTYDDAFVGKWHLSSLAHPDFATHPLDQGFSWFEGSNTNLNLSGLPSKVELDYHYWEKNINGVLEFTDTYATIDTTDTAIRRIDAMEEPWFLHVSYNAAHVPWSQPPDHLHSFGTKGHDEASYPDRMDAVVEAVDRELQRLLDGIPPDVLERTTVFLTSDNGTPPSGIRPPADSKRSKLTLYEGGTRVPLVAWGHLVEAPGTTNDSLVHLMDLFPTLGDIAGVRWQDLTFPDGRPRVIDGRSLMPYLRNPDARSQRDVLVTEKFGPNGGGPYDEYDEFAIRDSEYKYWRSFRGEHFFEINPDPNVPYEGRDLIALGEEGLTPTQQAALDRLRERVQEEIGAMAYDH